MFETGMSALVLKICSEYAKALGLNFPPCVQQEINAIAQYVDLHTVKDLKVEQNGSVVTITCFTEGEQKKVFTVTLPEVNVDVLFNLIKGSSSVVVDKSEDGTHLVVRLDKSQEVQYVELTPASAKNGNLTDTQLNILQANKGNCIILNNEIYRLADDENVDDLITYVHTGWDGTARKDKSISITVSTKAWTLVVADSGGGKLYLHVYSKGIENSGDPKNTVGSVDFVFYSSSSTQLTGSEFYSTIYAKNGMARVNCTIGGGYGNYTMEQTMYMSFDTSKSDYSIHVNEIFNPANTTLTMSVPTLYYKEFTPNIIEV